MRTKAKCVVDPASQEMEEEPMFKLSEERISKRLEEPISRSFGCRGHDHDIPAQVPPLKLDVAEDPPLKLDVAEDLPLELNAAEDPPLDLEVAELMSRLLDRTHDCMDRVTASHQETGTLSDLSQAESMENDIALRDESTVVQRSSQHQGLPDPGGARSSSSKSQLCAKSSELQECQQQRRSLVATGTTPAASLAAAAARGKVREDDEEDGNVQQSRGAVAATATARLSRIRRGWAAVSEHAAASVARDGPASVGGGAPPNLSAVAGLQARVEQRACQLRRDVALLAERKRDLLLQGVEAHLEKEAGEDLRSQAPELKRRRDSAARDVRAAMDAARMEYHAVLKQVDDQLAMLKCVRAQAQKHMSAMEQSRRDCVDALVTWASQARNAQRQRLQEQMQEDRAWLLRRQSARPRSAAH